MCPTPELFLAVFIQNGAILCNNDGNTHVLGYYETTRGVDCFELS